MMQEKFHSVPAYTRFSVSREAKPCSAHYAGGFQLPYKPETQGVSPTYRMANMLQAENKAGESNIIKRIIKAYNAR